MKIEFFENNQNVIGCYLFGMPMPDRNVEGNYRYKFQGQEKDPETGMEAFALRLYDSKIGRWLTVDPAREFSSPYLAMGNNPTIYVDKRGDTISFTKTFKQNKVMMKAYNLFAKTSYGKSFLAPFQLGGKYEHINVQFSIHSSKVEIDGNPKDAVDGRTYSRFKDAHSTIVCNGIRRINYDSFGRDVALGLDKTQRLDFNLSFSQSASLDNDLSIMGVIESISHETQHVTLNLNALVNMRQIMSTLDQHILIQNPNSVQFNQRASVWFENRGLWGDMVPDGQKDVEFMKSQM